MPNLKLEYPSIYHEIERIQPHSFHNDWLYILCKEVISSKHKRLPSTQSANRVNIGNGAIVLDNCTNATVTGCFLNNRPLDDVQIDAQGNAHILKGDGSSVIITKKNELLFEGRHIDLLEFLEISQREITTLISNLYS